MTDQTSCRPDKPYDEGCIFVKRELHAGCLYLQAKKLWVTTVEAAIAAKEVKTSLAKLKQLDSVYLQACKESSGCCQRKEIKQEAVNEQHKGTDHGD